MVQLCKEREELAKKTERADVKYIESKKKRKTIYCNAR